MIRCDLGVGCDEAGVCYADAHGEPERCGRPVLAFSFALGEVAPDGTIWLSPTERLTAGVAEITIAEAAKAERFGWERLSASEGGKVKVQRK